ncbi:hypothetical protein BJ170DRAFT_400662 [Xylariales sp. AK1849]|nr:hypothetical protein BJ170DRAFT_400662 [Xylariales sp. AK1849]
MPPAADAQRVEQKAPQSTEIQDRPKVRHLFAFTTWKHALPLTVGLIGSIFAGALKTSLAILLGEIFSVISNFGSGALLGPETISQVSRWCVILVVVGGLGWVANFIFMFAWMAFSEIQARNARHTMFRGLLKKDMEWFDCQPEGISSLLVRIQTQIRELQTATCIALGSLSMDIATALANLIVAFYFSWKLTLVILATVPVSVFILNFLSRNLTPAIHDQKRELALASKHAISAITAIDLVKTFNGIDHETWQYFTAIKCAMHSYLVQSRANAYQMSYVKFWMECMFVIGFYYGVVLVNDGMSAGHVMTTFYAALGALQAIESFMPMYLVLAKGMSAGQALHCIADDMEKGRKMKRMLGSFKPDRCVGEIKVNSVSFAYPSDPTNTVLNHASFFFPAGELCFIVGRSGSGKSTLSNLLLKFYEPRRGGILIDGIPLETIDIEWIRNNVTLVQQSSVLFDDTFFMNVAFGHRDPTHVSKDEVTSACEAALLQSTVAGLPHGLETQVGQGGHNLSGGQKQRLALARAKLRDPQILILDEVTSGLDPLSRGLIMDAIRQWRHGKTTVIITHEVGQIRDNDFVYAMDQGRVVQKGLSRELARHRDGLFAQLLASGGEVPSIPDDEKGVVEQSTSPMNRAFGPIVAVEDVYKPLLPKAAFLESPVSAFLWPGATPRTPGYLNRRMTLAIGTSTIQAKQIKAQQLWDVHVTPKTPGPAGSRTPMSSMSRSPSRSPIPTTATRVGSTLRDTFIQELPILPPMGRTSMKLLQERGNNVRGDRHTSGKSKRRLARNVTAIANDSFSYMTENGVQSSNRNSKSGMQRRGTSLWMIYQTVWTHLRIKERLYLIIGLLSCLIVAASIPAFSVVFANLLAALYAKGDRIAAGQKWAVFLLLIALVGAVALFLSHYFMEYAGQVWVNALRSQSLSRILRQPRPFFDRPKHAVGRINECMDRSAEEMRNLVGRFAPGLLIIAVMILTTIGWSMIISWRLTLVALCSGPFLVAATKGYSTVSYKWETQCNKAAEDTSAIMTETFTNIRVVRALTLERHFFSKYDKSASYTYLVGVKKAAWTASLFACWQTTFWFMMALIFYYATVLLTVNKDITVAAILKVVNLLVLGLSTASNMLNDVPGISAAQATAGRLLYYANLPVLDDNEAAGDGESVGQGNARNQSATKSKKKLIYPFPIRLDGLTFSYSSTSNGVPRAILHNITLEINPGTSTAIVGPSGSGKSTLASLLLTLHTPDIIPRVRNVRPSMYRHPLSFAGLPPSVLDLKSVRDHIGYVNQQPFLFPTSIKENITYGLQDSSPLRGQGNVQRAAREAGILDFMVSLPDGLDTQVGEGGQGLSGGQAQRVCIARALCRRPKLLVLDEPTSALDAQSAKGVRRTIERLIDERRGWLGAEALSPVVRGGRGRYGRDLDRWGQEGHDAGRERVHGEVAVVVVTHSTEMMRVCGRCVVLDQGRVVEVGSYEDLLSGREGKGRLRALVNGGLWMSGERRQQSNDDRSRRRRPKSRDGSVRDDEEKRGGENAMPGRDLTATKKVKKRTKQTWVGGDVVNWRGEDKDGGGVPSPLISPFHAP